MRGDWTVASSTCCTGGSSCLTGLGTGFEPVGGCKPLRYIGGLSGHRSALFLEVLETDSIYVHSSLLV